MRKNRFLLCLVMLACAGLIFVSAPAEDYTVVEEKEPSEHALPIDFSPGMPLSQDGFLPESEFEDSAVIMQYRDPTISVVVRKYTEERRYDYWIADIEIADASQLRTVSADGFDSDGLGPPTIMAEYMNAVLAIDGDYFSYKGHDFIIRQGITYLDHLNATRDILVIDEDGDFHGFISPDRDAIGDTVDGKRIINAFSFGPLLVNEGKIRRRGYSEGMAAENQSQRMAICQTGHLKYRVVCCGPYNNDPDRPKGMTLEDFQKLIVSMPDVWIAYNLDGGDSTFLIMNGQKLNYPENVNARDGIRNEGIADIIYFASAYSGEP